MGKGKEDDRGGGGGEGFKAFMRGCGEYSISLPEHSDMILYV